MVITIDHITVVVSNLNRSEKFYTEILGFSVIGRAHLEGNWLNESMNMDNVIGDVIYLRSKELGTRLELLKFTSPDEIMLDETSLPNAIGIRHIAFRVEDIDSLVEKLKKSDVEFVGKCIEVPNELETGGAGNKRMCYFHDPDGVLLELTQFTSEA